MRPFLPLLVLLACSAEPPPQSTVPDPSGDSGSEALARCSWTTLVETSGSDWLEDFAVRDDGVIVAVGTSYDAAGEGWVLWVEGDIRTEAHLATGKLNTVALGPDGTGWAGGSMVQSSSDDDVPALVFIEGAEAVVFDPPVPSGELYVAAQRDGTTWLGGRQEGREPVLLSYGGEGDFEAVDLGSEPLGGTTPQALLPLEDGLLIAARDLWQLGEAGLDNVLESTDGLAGLAELEDERWAVGQAGEVAVSRGAAWATDVGPSTSANFSAVWGAAPDDVWVLGTEVWHWDGSSWSEQPEPLDRGVVRAAHALPDGRLVALSQRDVESAWNSQLSVCDPPA